MDIADKTIFAGPARDRKPRSCGITAIIDFGPDGFGWTGPRGVEDMLECAGPYIDYAKIYAMNALLMPRETVGRIVRLYRDADVTPYAGGILFEYALKTGQLDGYVAHLKSLGIPKLEISENYIALTHERRVSLVERFRKAGLGVIYEFGRKNPEQPLDVDELGRLVSDMVSAGADHVIVEQSEMDYLRRHDPARIAELASMPWFDDILIEADPYAFPAQHVDLLAQFGRDANLANIGAGQALRLEGLRLGIGRAVNYTLITGQEGEHAP